jgi:glycosyltransferase 2 family protein
VPFVACCERRWSGWAGSGYIGPTLKRFLKLLASLLVTVVLTWWAFRETDWHEQWESLRSANYGWLIPYLGILLLVHVCRTVRWGFLLSGLERVAFRKLNEASAIGFMMLLVLPFRLGEFARPFLIAQRSGIRRSAAMTSVVLERIVDGLFVASLLRVLLFFVPANTPEVRAARWGSTLMFAIFGSGLAFLLFALWHQERAVALVRRTIGRVAPGIADKAAEIVGAFVGAMRHLPDKRRIAGFFLVTVAYWALNGWGMTMMTRAFGPGMHLSLFQGYVVLSVLVVGLMIPAAPGMMGTFQAATWFGLGLFLPAAVVNSQGLAYANVIWLCQTVQQIGFGLLFMSLSQMSFRDITQKLKETGAPAEPAL